ncbi:MAG: two pore domain potassium channel family protein, partial [Actinobacteria bacterium]|nr:two pore domain potassium channel family protein [Actinomycetota bacterium]
SFDVGTSFAGIVTVILAIAGPYLIWAGIRRRSLHIDVETVVAAICVFLMLGLAYASAFGVIAAIDPPFFAQDSPAERSELLYFSFVTITTTGYGDLSAGGNLGRSVAVSEAIIGQIYLVTVVALIVGNIGRAPIRDRLPRDERDKP